MRVFGRGKGIAVLGASALLLAGCICQVQCAEAKTKNISRNVYVGKSVKLPGGGKLRWTSRNSKIASVTSGGKVKAKSAGTTKIIGKNKKGKPQITCKVKTGNYITGIKLKSASSVTLSIDGKSRIRASVKGKQPLYSGFTYTTSDPDIAAVSAKGELTAMGGGLAEITVQSQATNKKGKRYQLKVMVYVQDTAAAPVPTQIPAPASDGAVVVAVELPVAATSAPGTQTPTAPAPVQTPPAAGGTISNVIPQIPKPSPDQLTAATLVVKDSAGNMQTLYFLNREYAGTMQMELFGYPFSSGAKVTDALKKIIDLGKAGKYVRNQGTRVLHVSTDYGKCAVKNLATEETVYFQVYETDPVYGTPYGLIVAQGDTRSQVAVK